MSILFGHPTGNPNSHQAALAHWEHRRLEAFCVPWMPTPAQLRLLECAPILSGLAGRLRRRCFVPLLDAPRVEGRLGEWKRMGQRLAGLDRHDGERLSYEANDWLMATMRRECRRPRVTAVHAYEDCSLGSFEEAKRLGKACIYDMPIGYYPAWQDTQQRLLRDYADWLPPGQTDASRYVRVEQKRHEMELADIVLVASSFVARTIAKFMAKDVRIAPYGVDIDNWRPAAEPRAKTEQVRFLYAGHISIRKGLPLLLEAWREAQLRDAQLDLVGSWHLAPSRRAELPAGVSYRGHCSPAELRTHYQAADVFVFPSFFEGFGLVISEAMACGLPVLASDATAGPDILDDRCGRVFPAGDRDALIDQLRYFSAAREQIPAMKLAARAKAEQMTWQQYRQRVSEAVAEVAG